ncbi:MAG TPA: GFA family protein [Acetobacteraceae bacterium]|nr:GFA family protein [Acetobacteraceae bacterium]
MVPEGMTRGGCLCGALRYEAGGEPLFAGYCFCADCRKASGSGWVPFMGYPSAAIRFSGETRQFRSQSIRGTESVRNSCPNCGGLVFGGEVGKDDVHTIYAGSLDDPACFHPTTVIFARDRPEWAPLPPGLTVFDTMPPISDPSEP